MRRRGAPALVLSAEHASPRVPAHLRAAFAAAGLRAEGHRAFDPGSRAIALGLSRAFDAPLSLGQVTRLVVDLNRSIGHPRLFSAATRGLGAEAREELIESYWRPFRAEVEARVEAATACGPALHLSLHSFTPELDGEVREVDLGLLYDPARPLERALAQAWRRSLAAAAPGLRVRFNRPYRGAADGHTTALRRVFPAERYAGLELEVNQALMPGGVAPRGLRAALERSLRELLTHRELYSC